MRQKKVLQGEHEANTTLLPISLWGPGDGRACLFYFHPLLSTLSWGWEGRLSPSSSCPLSIFPISYHPPFWSGICPPLLPRVKLRNGCQVTWFMGGGMKTSVQYFRIITFVTPASQRVFSGLPSSLDPFIVMWLRAVLEEDLQGLLFSIGQPIFSIGHLKI